MILNAPSDHIMLRSKRKLSNVLTRPILVDHNDIMLPEMQQNYFLVQYMMLAYL